MSLGRARPCNSCDQSAMDFFCQFAQERLSEAEIPSFPNEIIPNLCQRGIPLDTSKPCAVTSGVIPSPTHPSKHHRGFGEGICKRGCQSPGFSDSSLTQRQMRMLQGKDATSPPRSNHQGQLGRQRSPSGLKQLMN